MKKVVVAGASGFVGKYLCSFLEERGWSVIRVGRTKTDATWSDQPSLIRALDGASAVVNLAGKSVNCRFNAQNVEQLISSRVETTRAIGEAIALCNQPPAVWINASGASIYRETNSNPNTEDSAIDGAGTMAEVARKWEQSLSNASTPNTRKVALRITLVLGKNGGVYPTFRLLTKAFQGGKQGSGKQVMSWIHLHDLCRLILATIESTNPPLILNAAAPKPLSNENFMACFRNALGVSFGLNAPEFLIKMGTAVLGVDSELVLRGMNVTSNRVDQLGFKFLFPSLELALADLSGK
jgi:uncharacterized protein (TIGR01777 family)